MDYAKESLRLHGEWKGKIEVVATVPVATKDDLSLAYTPGVAQPCLEINKDVNKSYELTRRHNLCAVVTDGTAVLGLGDIGPEAGMPVMEGKCVLFKAFGDVDAFPLCVKSKDVDEIVNTMNKDAIVFACANPTPEIFPDDAKAGGARVISTGRSDYPNQVNNVLCFPGIFRGALDVRASRFTENMKIAAAKAITSTFAPLCIPKAVERAGRENCM